MRSVPGVTDHVVVIGAGLSGLSAALHLAGRGRSVTVVERHPFPGGRMGQADIAGYRIDRTMEGVRRAVYSLAYNGLIGLLFGWPHRDINFSFKLMRREVLDAIELRSEGSLIDAELVVKAKHLGFSIQQLGLDYFPRTRGQSHLAGIGVVMKILVELVRLFPEMRRPLRRR